jgi:hypothetical protein
MAGYGIQIKGMGRAMMKKGGKAFPDLTGDGKVTRADVLKGRGVFAKGGTVRDYAKVVEKKRKSDYKTRPAPRPRGNPPVIGKDEKRKRLMPKAKPGMRTKMMGGGRANLLEEMGRIDSEKMNPNRRAEKRRVISELNRGMKKGGRVPKGYHKTKDGRVAKKGLYYYMNRAKKRGTSKPGKGSVTDKALKQSAKTAKK